jgi:hypothetical protein
VEGGCVFDGNLTRRPSAVTATVVAARATTSRRSLNVTSAERTKSPVPRSPFAVPLLRIRPCHDRGESGRLFRLASRQRTGPGDLDSRAEDGPRDGAGDRP